MTEARAISDGVDLKALIERVRKRADEDRVCAENSESVAEALSGQLAIFEARSGEHNVYAVRMAVDHQNAAKRDRRYEADLRDVLALLTSLSEDKPHAK